MTLQPAAVAVWMASVVVLMFVGLVTAGGVLMVAGPVAFGVWYTADWLVHP